MIDVMRTLKFMKPTIKVQVWDTDNDGIPDVNGIVYNETETFRPTVTEVLAVSQDDVAAYWATHVYE